MYIPIKGNNDTHSVIFHGPIILMELVFTDPDFHEMVVFLLYM